MQRYFNTIINDSGAPLAGALVRVTQSGLPASIYSDNGVTPAANPLVADGSGAFQFYAADGTYTLTITYNGIVVKTLPGVVLGSDSASNTDLSDWALTQSFTVTSATRNSDGAITTASITWPDGVTGTYTADVLSTAFPGSTDAWHATYNASGTKTVTQPTVTRDSNGAVTAQPAITIS